MVGLVVAYRVECDVYLAAESVVPMVVELVAQSVVPMVVESVA